MKQQLATLTAEVTFPEREKFTAPLLLLPGLWSGSWVWNEVAWGLSQRGWECWALDLYQQVEYSHRGRVSCEDHLNTISTAASALSVSPIVLGFDIGSLFAVLSAVRIRPRAIVCIAPLLPRAWRPDARPALPLVRLGALPALIWALSHPPPHQRMARDFLFHTLPTPMHAHLHANLEPDSGLVVRALTQSQVAFPPTPLPCPVCVVWGHEDRMTVPVAARWFADSLDADSLTYPNQGHWLVAGPQAATLVADVHRWLVRTLGEALLLPPEDDA